jgi:penicillin-binding protein-related factor A (putative recombinase)
MDRKQALKRISGARAKAKGQWFENVFRSTCHAHQVSCIRIPDGAKTIRSAKGKQVIRVKSPWDFDLGWNYLTARIDCKNYKKSFTHSSINPNQLNNLNTMSKHCITGYVVLFDETNLVVFFDTSQVKNLKPRQSLVSEDGLILGMFPKFDPRLIFRDPTHSNKIPMA